MPRLYHCEMNKPPKENLPCKKCPPKKAPNKKKKLSFKTCKKNTMNSLNEVEHFLRNFHGFMNYIKLYKLLK